MVKEILTFKLVKALISIENAIIKLIECFLFHQRQEGKVEKVLILTSARIGDFIVTIPAIKKIRESFPNANILLLCTDGVNKLHSERLDGHPQWFGFADHLVDEIIFVKGSEIVKTSTIQNLRNIISKNSPDIVFALDPVGAGIKSKIKKAFFLRCIGVKCKVYGLKVIFDLNIKSLRKAYFKHGLIKHMSWGPLNAVTEIIKTYDKSPSYSVHIDLSKVRDEIRKLANQKNYIILFPGGASMIKRWPNQKYFELIRRLKHKWPTIDFYVIGGNDCDFDLGSDNLIRQLIKTNLCGQTNLMETAYLIKDALLFIGNDSGPAHLSAALGTQTVVIENSQNHPGLWWDSSQPNVHVIRKEPHCAFCYAYPVCPNNTFKCINDIEVEDVEEVVHCVLHSIMYS